MINSRLFLLISHNFPHKPNENQEKVLVALVDFLLSTESESVFLLKGYAGTGKTSLVGALVKTLKELKQKTVLLAPTGRAAMVFSLYAEQKAYTIHKKIYRQRAFSNEPVGFLPAKNMHTDTLFIVDEASMISNETYGEFAFGTGRLLDDLVQYVYSGERCRLLFMGDEAQLPPVMQTESPALSRHFVEGYNLKTSEALLTQVVRQASHSGILYNATALRNALKEETTSLFPKLSFSGYKDFISIQGDELIDTLGEAYSRDGLEETIVITRSNKRAAIYNNGVRNRILDHEEVLCTGDRLMVAKNNYFWLSEGQDLDFLANGEMVQVLRIRKTMDIYGFHFADVLLRFQDYDLEYEVKVLLDTLQTETPALPRELGDKLFHAVLEDYEDLRTKVEKMKAIKADPFFNAVQVKYAYAVTCHKAQGGQWMNVFVDIGYMTEEMLGEDFYRWLYTAITRATHRIYFVNIPKDFIEKNNE